MIIATTALSVPPILVGLDNPHRPEPEYALYPLPRGCTGWRIWQMLNSRTGASRQDYVRVFDRRNVCDMADESEFPAGSTVVLLGEQVRCWADRRIGLPRVFLLPQVIDGVTYRQIPHPSGLNLFYNSPVNRGLVALMLEELYNDSKEVST